MTKMPGDKVAVQAMEAFLAGDMVEADRLATAAKALGVTPVPPRGANGLVYFVGCDFGLIKIGTAVDVARRLDDLQAGSPVKLHIIGTLPGGKAKETELHRRFKHLRKHGEWFTAAPELREFIQRECK